MQWSKEREVSNIMLIENSNNSYKDGKNKKYAKTNLWTNGLTLRIQT